MILQFCPSSLGCDPRPFPKSRPLPHNIIVALPCPHIMGPCVQSSEALGISASDALYVHFQNQLEPRPQQGQNLFPVPGGHPGSEVSGEGHMFQASIIPSGLLPKRLKGQGSEGKAPSLSLLCPVAFVSSLACIFHIRSVTKLYHSTSDSSIPSPPVLLPPS